MTSPSADRTSPGESSFGHPEAHEAFDLDVLLRALAHPCRRAILCLLDAEPTWTRTGLSASLDTVETIPSTVLDGETEVSLHHRHLPMLEEANLLVVDEESGRVERGEDFDQVREMIDAAVAVML